MQFCDNNKFQLFGDPENKTFNILVQYFDEVMPIFPDEVIHFGMDELSNTGRCNPTNFAQLERYVFEYVHKKGKRPMAWEEATFSAKSTFEYNIVDGWQRHTALEATKLGYDAVESAEPFFYLDHVNENHQWFDLPTVKQSSNIKGSNKLGWYLGGEVSMWTDNFCYLAQCESAPGRPVGYELYNPKYDTEFKESIISIIFPRTIKAAGKLTIIS